MDLNAAQVFVSVVKAGSFTEASRVMGVPVSTVSDKVASLEKDLGVSLLTRTTRSLKLTEIGAEFFKKAEEAIAVLMSAKSEATLAGEEPTGTLRITGPTDYASVEIAEAIAVYRKKFPKVKVEAFFTNRRVDMLAEGYDIAIRGGELEDSSLIAKKVGAGKMILVASAEYLKKAPPLKHPKDLQDHAIIRFQQSEVENVEVVWKLKTVDGKTATVRPHFDTASTTFSVIIELVKIGEGIALIPAQVAFDEVEKKKILRVLPEWSTGELPVHLVYQAQRFNLPKVKEMVPLLETRLKGMMNRCVGPALSRPPVSS